MAYLGQEGNSMGAAFNLMGAAGTYTNLASLSSTSTGAGAFTTAATTTATFSQWWQAQQQWPQSQLAQLQLSQLQTQPLTLRPPTVSNLPEETMVAAVVGWRSWNAGVFSDELMSFNGTVWTPYEWLKAECKDGTCRGLDCSCGIYAWKSFPVMHAQQYDVQTPDKYVRVCGEVYLKGHILQCRDGFRASYAYPKSFVDTGALARRMAIVFSVPLVENLVEKIKDGR